MTAITGTEWLEHPGSVGRPVGCRIKIVGRNGEELAPNSIGEVFMMSDSAEPTYRYIGAEQPSCDGWDSLGDMGWLDQDGYLYLTDRKTDMIVTGGANVYPAEVEAALDSHPGVVSSAVIGLPDDDLGQRVHAIVELDSAVPDAELSAHVAQRLVRYKVPRSFERSREPLRDAAGKVCRSALRDQRISS